MYFPLACPETVKRLMGLGAVHYVQGLDASQYIVTSTASPRPGEIYSPVQLA